MERRETGEDLVFGLDIGTRNVVGTVGYRQGKEFIVVAQYSVEHETRAMLDGQIHDIRRVGNTIRVVKDALERQIGRELTEVCIAAAGRVLKTVTTDVEYRYESESVVTAEDVHTLDLLGIEKAQGILREQNDTAYKFYCVGYSVVKYYLNEDIFSNLEGHKAERIAENIIVTFLPEDVVDGLYAAVAIADLAVANMTLEPIAAIDIAVPENFRMLNIALVDVGAGTSDICVTRDGSIIAYGMIPLAGDEITELIVQTYLVDFAMAEHIKLASTTGEDIDFTDIMSLKHTIKSQEIWDLTENLVDRITTDVADKIMELNGDKTVSATFVVGGGGKIHGFTTMLADKLELPYERVALRGEEVLREVTFEQQEIEKDPLLVTPLGICLNYYEQKNSFIMVHFNGERVKLYDNGHLTIVDAAIQAGFPNDLLFPKRGKEINFSVNGSPRVARGEAGESAIVKVNGNPANINAPLLPNSYITVEPSTAGEAARLTLGDIADYTAGSVNFIVNGQNVRCPRFVEVNGSIELSSYEIREGDAVDTRSFYTVGQLAEFMDVAVDPGHAILVNNRQADLNTLVYENFTIDWTLDDSRPEGISYEQYQEEAAMRERERLAAERRDAERESEKGKEKEAEGASEKRKEGERAKEEADAEGGETAREEKDAEGGEAAKKEKGEAASKEKDAVRGEAAKKEKEAERGETAREEKDAEGGEAAKKSEEASAQERLAAGRKEQDEPDDKDADAGDEGGTFAGKDPQMNGDIPSGGNPEPEGTAPGGDHSELESEDTAPSKENPASAAESKAKAEGTASGGKNPASATEPKAESKGTAPCGENLPAGSGEVPAGGIAPDSKNFSAEGGTLPTEDNSRNDERQLEEQRISEDAKPSVAAGAAAAGSTETTTPKEPEKPASVPPDVLEVTVNGIPVKLTGKRDYIFVDLFEYIHFDLSASNGRAIVTKVNGESAAYVQKLNSGDAIEIYWEEK